MANREMRRSRVLVAAAGLFLGLFVLWLRIGWLQIARHEHYEQRAQRNQERRTLVKPVRGRLDDRHGRPLARDLKTYSISAAPRQMEKPREIARRLAKVLKLDARSLERRFARRPLFLYVARQIPPQLGMRVEALDLPGVYVGLETRREYLLGEAAAEIIGRTDLDNTGVEGIELQLDATLRGLPGWSTQFQIGNGQTHELQGRAKRPPEDGRNAVLTIDADLQAIVEFHLARALDTLRAERAFAVFIDPRTGEILAAANVPHLPAGRSRNWNVTDLIEPGSTFKIVVAAAALEEGAVQPDEWIEASDDPAGVQVAPDAVFADAHREAGFTFRDAVRWSSNIVMAKVAMTIGPETLYRYATGFGFGSVTGLGFPGEAGGTLRTPDRWSARSAATIAIGYEVSVTPLQLVLAYGALANGGMLMHPMLVREIRDNDGSLVRRFAPHAARRVFRESTARMMREFLTAVVDSGTARSARVAGIPIAGKTGTARKYDAEAGRYSNQRHLSSFAGIARADRPTLAGVVVIDEPRGGRYYGGDVAAPVFREIVLDLQRLPGSLLHGADLEVAARPEPPKPVMVPNLRLLLSHAAERELHARGLRAGVRGEGERVVAQQPAAGTSVEGGTRVVVWLSAPDDATHELPDLTGLASREAIRVLSRIQVAPRIEGSGVVVRQSPAPGTALPLRTPVRLWCEPVRASADPVLSAAPDLVPAGARAAPPGGNP